MRSPMLRLAATALASTCLLLAGACSAPRTAPSGTAQDASNPPGASDKRCVVNADAVPSCGVLLGVATRPPTMGGVTSVERAIGRRFDFVYRYHDLNDKIPDAAERRVVAQGRLLHISIAARDFSQPDRSAIGWAAVAAGDYDAALRRQAIGVASLKVPVFVTFEQEANQNDKVGERGSPADFIAAWRRVHAIYESAGATNAVWVWVMTGSEDNLDNAAALWPGNDQVDWISWNVYNQSGCKSSDISVLKFVSFEQKLAVFYRFLQARGPALGIDTSKPLMISEAGSAHYPGQMSLTAGWYLGIPATLEQYPTIKAVALWNSVNGACDYRFSTVGTLRTAVQKMSEQPPFDAALRLEPSR